MFRPPPYSALLSIFVGSGIHLFVVSASTMLCITLGLTSLANRGTILTTLILFYTFAGYVGGYYSSRVYKLCQGKDRIKHTLYTALLLPLLFGLLYITIIIVSYLQRSSMIPVVSILFEIFVLISGVLVPSVFLGSYYGLKKENIYVASRSSVNPTVPTVIPSGNPLVSQLSKPKHRWLYYVIILCIELVISYSIFSCELDHIMSALWLQQVS